MSKPISVAYVEWTYVGARPCWEPTGELKRWEKLPLRTGVARSIRAMRAGSTVQVLAHGELWLRTSVGNHRPTLVYRPVSK